MNVAMLHMGDSPHPAHQGFAEAVDADWINAQIRILHPTQ